MIDGGLSATVNVKIARPVDVGTNRIALNMEGIYETNPKKVTPHVSAFVSGVFADGPLGINLGVNYERRRVIQTGFTGYGVETAKESNKNLDNNLDSYLDDTYSFDHATTIVSDDGEFVRKSAVGGIQFKPSDNFDIHIDAIYTDFLDSFNRYEHQLRWTNISATGAKIVGSTINSDGLLTFLDANGVDHQSNNLLWSTRNQTFASGIGTA